MSIKKYHKSKNIFNVTPAMRDASNWEVRTYYGSKYFMFFELPTEFCVRLSAKAFLKSGGSYYTGEVVGFANFQEYTNGNLEIYHRILDNDGSTPDFSIDLSSTEKVYLTIGIGSGIREGNKQTLIDEFFDNYDTMAVQGIVVPSVYEPYDPEVWHSVPYRKYDTETDTITTLPATIIGDGTPISSYTIKGNMEQNGTPTPSSPIYPSECGDLVTSGEHAGQYKLPLTLGNTTTDIYLGEVQSTRRIKKLVLDGTEDWKFDAAAGNRVQYEISDIQTMGLRRTTFYCSHYVVIDDGRGYYDVPNNSAYTSDRDRTTGKTNIYIQTNAYSTAADFKAFLAAQYAAGTPVTIWYVLAEPTAGIVNEPLSKIGDYVDSVSGTNLATSGTAQEFNINTTLKPSEIDLTYHGWHEHANTNFTT